MEKETQFELVVEDILENANKKKKKHSKHKGDRAEREICQLLNARFPGKNFERSVGSGNRWGQVKSLPEHAKTTLLGDICPPEGFKWVLESKSGYEKEIDFHSILEKGNAKVEEFMKQAQDEANRSGRPPMIFYKRSRRPWIAMLRREDLKGHNLPSGFSIAYTAKEGVSWVMVSLTSLLTLPDEFWFEKIG